MAAVNAVDDMDVRPATWPSTQDDHGPSQPSMGIATTTTNPGPGLSSSNDERAGSNAGPGMNNTGATVLNQDPEHPETHHATRGSSVGDVSMASVSESTHKNDNQSSSLQFREKQMKPNKVYIGGLPENTREEDLQNCFGKIGSIVNIELKVGYGFVEFDTREAAEESVSKYNEGYFMGKQIRVELAHGGGRTAKFTGEPGACFRCGQMGHWARECPSNNGVPYQRRSHHEPHLIERIGRDYPPRGPPRDDYTHSRYPPPPPRDSRYDYPPPPRRPPSPREYRDYAPPPPHRSRDYDDYRRGPPPAPAPPLPPMERDRYPPPPPDYRGRYPPVDPPYRGYNGPAPPPPPPASYDRYDRRERYPPYPPARARTPPRGRDDYDRLPPRDYPEYRGRPVTPPPNRYADYNRPPPDPPARYRRRSESPRPAYDYPSNSYNGGNSSGPGHLPPPPRGSGRDYPPPRNGRDPVEPMGGYRRP